MTPNMILALVYLLTEAVNAGLNISDVLTKADETGALPPEVVAAIRAKLKEDFTHHQEYWNS